MFEIPILQKAWKSLVSFPWPTITFFAMVMSAWGWSSYKAEVSKSQEQSKAHLQDVKEFMKDKDALQQQTIQSGNRLIDELIRKNRDQNTSR